MSVPALRVPISASLGSKAVMGMPDTGSKGNRPNCTVEDFSGTRIIAGGKQPVAPYFRVASDLAEAPGRHS